METFEAENLDYQQPNPRRQRLRRTRSHAPLQHWSAALGLDAPLAFIERPPLFELSLSVEFSPLPTETRAVPAGIDALFRPAEPSTSHPSPFVLPAYSAVGKAHTGGVLKPVLRISQLLSNTNVYEKTPE